jgi:hypothetical protein
MAVIIFFLIDVTKMLVLDGTMQYKVHKWHLDWMNGRIPYEVDVGDKPVRLYLFFMAVRKCFYMAVSEYLRSLERLRFHSAFISFKGYASIYLKYILLTINYLKIFP